MEARLSPHLLGPAVRDEPSVKVGHSMNVRQAESQLGMLPPPLPALRLCGGRQEAEATCPLPTAEGNLRHSGSGDNEGEMQETPEFFPLLVREKRGSLPRVGSEELEGWP